MSDIQKPSSQKMSTNSSPESTTQETHETKILMEQIQRDIQQTREMQQLDPSIIHASTVPPELLVYLTEEEREQRMKEGLLKLKLLQEIIDKKNSQI